MQSDRERNIVEKKGLWQVFSAQDGVGHSADVVTVDDATSVWIAGSRGICRYNGVSLEVFPNPFGDIENPHVFGCGCPAPPDSGLICLGARNGLTVFDGTTCAHMTGEDGLPDTRVHDLFRDRNGLVWIVSGGHLATYDGRKISVFSDKHELPDGEIMGVAEDGEGLLWISTKKGLYSFNGNTCRAFSSKDGVPCDEMDKITCGVEGNVWISSEAGLICFDGKSFNVIYNPPFKILASDLCADPESGVWLASWRRMGAFHFTRDRATCFTTENGLRSNIIYNICIDEEKTVWFASGPGGLCRYNPSCLRMLANNFDIMEMISGGPDVFWTEHDHEGRTARIFSCRSGGDTVSITHYEDAVRKTFADSGGNLYLLTLNGVLRCPADKVYDNASESDFDKIADGEFESAYEDNQGRLWFGGYKDTLVRCDDAGLERYTLPEDEHMNVIQSITEDSRSRMWLAGTRRSGLLRLDGEEFTRILPSEEFPMSRITAVRTDSQGRVWIGGQASVLRAEGDEIVSVSKAFGLPDIYTECFCEDSRGFMWIGTNGYGIVKMDEDNFQIITADDGLPCNHVISITEDKDHNFVIVTRRGVCRFEPHYDTYPEMSIRHIDADRRYEHPESIKVQEYKGAFVIRLQGHSLKPHALRFTCRMEGLDEEWRASSGRTIWYENLPVGEYVFRAKAIDRDLVYSEEVSVRISVTPETKSATIRQLRGLVELTQEELSDAREYAHNILRSMNEGVIVTDEQGSIITVNYAMLNILGYLHDDLVDQPVSKVLADKDEELFSSTGIAEIIEEGVLAARERILVGKARNRVPVLLSASCMSDRTGAVHGVVIVASDLTEHRKMQDALMQAQKMENIGVLAGGIAHDFNNLLAVIMGNLEMAGDEVASDSPGRECLNDALAASSRAAGLCKQLLAYAGHGRYVVKVVDLSVLVAEMTGLLAPAVCKKIALEYDLADGLPAIEADETQICQVVMNLVTNASEAIGDQEGRICVKTGVTECTARELTSSYFDYDPPAGRYAFIEVSDSGSGISQEAMKNLFDPFYTTKFSGRGLGLAAVHGIIRGQSGTVQIETVEGKGTTFRALLPATGDAPAAAAPGVDYSGVRFSGTILVVDDELPVLEMARRMLISLGLTVQLAESGRDAVDRLAGAPSGFDVAVLDMTMPGMNGVETLAELRKIRPDLPVIVSSGYTEKDISREFADNPPAAFVQKPYRRSALTTALTDILPASQLSAGR